jgi:hypothetical protein
MKIKIHPHAAQRIRERGASAAQVRETVMKGQQTPTKFGRVKFTLVFPFGKMWNGKKYARQEIEAFAATIPNGWLVVTVIVKYF